MFKLLCNAPSVVKKVLIKLSVAVCFLICLTMVCFANIDRSLVAVIAATTVIVVLPVTLMLSIDASRMIRNVMPQDRKAIILATVLAIPQVVLGVALLLVGLVFPFILVSDVITDIRGGQPIFLHAISILTAFFMLIVGYFYILEGLGLRKHQDQNAKPGTPKKKKASTFRRRL
jgi:hypothetical protein